MPSARSQIKKQVINHHDGWISNASVHACIQVSIMRNSKYAMKKSAKQLSQVKLRRLSKFDAAGQFN